MILVFVYFSAVAVSTIGDFTNAPPNNAALTAIRNIFDCAVEQVEQLLYTSIKLPYFIMGCNRSV